MNNRFVRALIAGMVGLSGPAFGHREMMGPGPMMAPGQMGMSMVRHHYVMLRGLDPRYAAKKSLLQPTKQNVENGKRLFERSCAQCHGLTGTWPA